MKEGWCDCPKAEPDNGVLAAEIPLEVSLSLKQWKQNNLMAGRGETVPTQRRLVPLCHTGNLNQF